MKRIANALCLCGCECCLGECIPTELYVTFTGTQNANCGDAVLWVAKWKLVLVADCWWEKDDGLPCNGTLLTLAIACPQPFFGLHTTELEVSENGKHVASFYQFNGAVKQIDCRNIGLLGGFTPTGNPQDEVDWTLATARITDE